MGDSVWGPCHHTTQTHSLNGHTRPAHHPLALQSKPLITQHYYSYSAFNIITHYAQLPQVTNQLLLLYI